MEAQILIGDCLEHLRTIPDNSVDSIVTDPPYGLSNTTPEHVAETLTAWVTGDREFLPTAGGGFMGKAWDSFVPPVAVWDECLRVLKPGGYLLTFAGSRTMDLMTLGVRLAGFEIRDSIAWLYGSGFPKSHDVSKALDKMAGAEREIIGERKGGAALNIGGDNPRPWHEKQAERGGTYDVTAPATDAAKQWEGWGTALKPAFEPVIMARKPFRGTVAANVLEHGTGALNIDASRIGASGGSTQPSGVVAMNRWKFEQGARPAEYIPAAPPQPPAPAGRFPANVILDESQAAALDEQSGTLTSGKMKAGTVRARRDPVVYGELKGRATVEDTRGDSGGASRFFYTAKASKRERPVVDGVAHPTVKPLALMRYLIKLVTPPGGTVLDPFAGSGTTLEAAQLEGFASIGIEREQEYVPLIFARLERVAAERAGTLPG